MSQKDDLISRQAAIETLIKPQSNETHDDYWEGKVAQYNFDVIALQQMPSAEPEIIRCKDCVHSDTFPKCADNDMPLKCLYIRYGGVMPDWYCEHAERRTDG